MRGFNFGWCSIDGGFGRHRDRPEAIGVVSWAFDDYGAVFDDVDVMFGE